MKCPECISVFFGVPRYHEPPTPLPEEAALDSRPLTLCSYLVLAKMTLTLLRLSSNLIKIPGERRKNRSQGTTTPNSCVIHSPAQLLPFFFVSHSRPATNPPQTLQHRGALEKHLGRLEWVVFMFLVSAGVGVDMLFE